MGEWEQRLARFEPSFPRRELRLVPGPGDLKQLGSTTGGKLPPEYAAFLREAGGIVLRDAGVRVEERVDVSVEVFYGFGEDGYPFDLLERRDTYDDRLPAGALPIAEAGGGNQFFLALAGRDAGQIFLWDHDHPRSELPSWVLERVRAGLASPAAQDALEGLEFSARSDRELLLLRWDAARDVLPWWDCIYRVAPSFEAFVAGLSQSDPQQRYPDGRVGSILRALDAGATWEWTSVGGREALRICHVTGERQISVLSAEERALVEPALRGR